MSLNRIIMSFAVFLFTACADKKKNIEGEEYISRGVVKQTLSTALQDLKRGEELIAASDCLACHKVNEKLVGPSYQDVANKYESKDEAMLVGSIINGCDGKWGEIAMMAHPDLPKDDALQMVKYILSLKK